MWNEPQEPLPDEVLVYIGAYSLSVFCVNPSDLDVEIARGVARGDIHPMTKAALSEDDKENLKVCHLNY